YYLSSFAHALPRSLHSFPTRRSSDLARARPRARLLPRTCRAHVRTPLRLGVAARTAGRGARGEVSLVARARAARHGAGAALRRLDRKSTRLNSSHRTISYAVFCLKKK